MSFLDALSAAVTPALQYRTGQLQGEQEKQDKSTQGFLGALQIARQQQAAALDQQLKNAQIKNYNSESEARLAPKQPESFTLAPGATRFGPDGKPIATSAAAEKPPIIHTFADGVKESTDGGKTWTKIGNAPQPGPSFTPLVTTDSTGKQVVRPFNTKTGEAAPPVADAKQGAGGAGGALSGITMQTMGRMGTSFNDLQQSIDQMEAMENNPEFRKKLTSMSKSLMAGAESHPNADAHGITGFLSNMGGQYAAGKAQETLDPDLNTYLNLKQRVGTAFTELLPRPNQQLLQIEKGLSGIDVGWNPQLMAGIQARRRGGLDVLKNILSKQGMIDAQGRVDDGSGGPSLRAGGGMPTGKPMSTRAYQAAKAAGHTDAEIQAAGYAIPQGNDE